MPPSIKPFDFITFYVRLGNLHMIIVYEQTLKILLHHHVIPTKMEQCLKLISYFKPQRLGAFFSPRSHKVDTDKVNVVYQFSCTAAGCQASYIGHTTCTLKKQYSQHKYCSRAVYI